MAEVLTLIKLQIEGGKATPAPPVGPALGQRQLNIMDFCKQFNDRTKHMTGKPCPVIITAYKDKTFSFIVKLPPVTYYIKQLLNIQSGSKTPGRETIKTIKKSDLLPIAREKMVDMNAFDIESAIEMIAGSARSMGILVTE